LAADNLFLRKQLAMYQERKIMPRGFDNVSRSMLVLLSRWSTFVSNHAKAIVACDFLTVVTSTLKTLYMLVIIKLGTLKWRNTYVVL
jgi:hypothetical protein